MASESAGATHALVQVMAEGRSVGSGSRRSMMDQSGNMTPGLQLQQLLGEDAQIGEEPHIVFSEMQELRYEQGVLGEWKEKARWIKFEEDVEDGSCRWTKPFVGTLSLHAMFELRSHLMNSSALLYVASTTMDEIVAEIVRDMVAIGQMPQEDTARVTELLMRPHHHQYEKERSNTLLLPSLDLGRRNSTSLKSNVLQLPGVDTGRRNSLAKSVTQGLSRCSSTSEMRKGNSAFMKKIPPGAEVANVLIGEADFLEKPVAAFVRLARATVLDDLSEVALPTRFFFVLLGPKEEFENYREVGRVVATLMSDEVFNAVAYKATKRHHLLAGLDEFLDAVTVLPPGEWDPTIRIEPPAAVPSQEPRKNPDKPLEIKGDPDLEEYLELRHQGLVRTGRLFGGLIDDVKRKLPWYKSDFTDAFHIQSLASIMFLYFAALSPIITFGGLLGEATDHHLAAVESLCAGCICGVVYSLCSGQPLSLLNATGPVLVFESIVFSFCKSYGFDYLSLRLWIGVWIGVFMVLLCAFEISAWVAYITRFTEENFAMLIATIYVYKAVEKIIKIGVCNPLYPPQIDPNATDCFCVPSNETGDVVESIPWIGLPLQNCTEMWNGTMTGRDCHAAEWHPNVFVVSVLLSTFTYLLCVTLKGVRHSSYFPSVVRNTVSDFSVFICICAMTALDAFMGVHTPKLHVPDEFKPTRAGRGWIVNPFHPANPWWIIPATMLPALLATILMFLDQQITAVIVNRKENKLKKGCGYHLDLFVLAFLMTLMGVMGLPWHVAGTVLCINHINSLKKESETAAPGERPVFLGVREQRVTHLVIFLLVGVSVFMTPMLKLIPMPVLYGIFLYMGLSPLSEMQFFDRMRIFFMPSKYQPDLPYLRQVRLKRIHLFTLIQLVCFAILWFVKMNETISITFPLMLVIIIFVRKCLDFYFTKDELRVLDAVLPPFRQKDFQQEHRSVSSSDLDAEPAVYSALARRKSINISDEVTKSAVWKHVHENKLAGRGADETEPTPAAAALATGERRPDL